jgi:hypothetical protein
VSDRAFDLRLPKQNLNCAEIAYPDFHQIASAKLAIDSEVKERTISDSPMLVEKAADRPYLTGLNACFAPTFRPGFQDTR